MSCAETLSARLMSAASRVANSCASAPLIDAGCSYRTCVSSRLPRPKTPSAFATSQRPYTAACSLACHGRGRSPVWPSSQRGNGAVACHTRATAARDPGTLTATRAQLEQSMTCEHAGCSRRRSVLLSSSSHVRIALRAPGLGRHADLGVAKDPHEYAQVDGWQAGRVMPEGRAAVAGRMSRRRACAWSGYPRGQTSPPWEYPGSGPGI